MELRTALLEGQSRLPRGAGIIAFRVKTAVHQ